MSDTTFENYQKAFKANPRLADALDEVASWFMKHAKFVGGGMWREVFAHPYDPRFVVKVPRDPYAIPANLIEYEVCKGGPWPAPLTWVEWVDGIPLLVMERLKVLGHATFWQSGQSRLDVCRDWPALDRQADLQVGQDSEGRAVVLDAGNEEHLCPRIDWGTLPQWR